MAMARSQSDRINAAYKSLHLLSSSNFLGSTPTISSQQANFISTLRPITRNSFIHPRTDAAGISPLILLSVCSEMRPRLLRMSRETSSIILGYPSREYSRKGSTRAEDCRSCLARLLAVLFMMVLLKCFFWNLPNLMRSYTPIMGYPLQPDSNDAFRISTRSCRVSKGSVFIWKYGYSSSNFYSSTSSVVSSSSSLSRGYSSSSCSAYSQTMGSMGVGFLADFFTCDLMRETESLVSSSSLRPVLLTCFLIRNSLQLASKPSTRGKSKTTATLSSRDSSSFLRGAISNYSQNSS